MKRIITSAFVILLTIGAAQAQTTSTEKNKNHKKEHRRGGFESLNLSPDQQAKMKLLKQDFKKQSAELKSNTQLSETDKKARRQELHQQHRAQVEAILTPAQKDELAKKKASWKAAGKNARKNAKRGGDKISKGSRQGVEGRSAGFEKELNLSADQQAKMTQIRTDFKSRSTALRNDTALSQDQKRSKMKELMKQQQEQVKSVLTKEQLEKMQSLRKERSARNTR